MEFIDGGVRGKLVRGVVALGCAVAVAAGSVVALPQTAYAGSSGDSATATSGASNKGSFFDELSSLTDEMLGGTPTKTSSDKHVQYMRDYRGSNASSVGYTAINGNRHDKYGSGTVQIVFVANDGSYVDIDDEKALSKYTVVAQNIEPDTQIDFGFLKDSDGKEYDSLVAWQSYELITLTVKEKGDTSTDCMEFATPNPSPDKYTCFVRDYMGMNLASVGYVSWGGDLRDGYGESTVKLNPIDVDGEYIDLEDAETLKKYMVVGQNYDPNTQFDLVFLCDSEGVEYDSLVSSQGIEVIDLYVARIAD